MTDHITWTAMNYLRCGLSAFPLGANSKRPVADWATFQSNRASIKDAQNWGGGNLGIATGAVSGIVVVDCESRENADWFLKYRAVGLSPGIVATPRGFHLYFQHPGQRVKNITHVEDEQGISRYDIRGDGGYVVAPPSMVDGKEYRWIREFFDPKKLPTFRRWWRPETRPEETKPQPGTQRHRFTNHGDAKIRNGAAYISKIHAVSGSGGHDRTFCAACYLRESGISEEEAYSVLIDWNETNAHPPWSQQELLHKIKSAYSK